MSEILTTQRAAWGSAIAAYYRDLSGATTQDPASAIAASMSGLICFAAREGIPVRDLVRVISRDGELPSSIPEAAAPLAASTPSTLLAVDIPDLVTLLPGALALSRAPGMLTAAAALSAKSGQLHCCVSRPLIRAGLSRAVIKLIDNRLVSEVRLTIDAVVDDIALATRGAVFDLGELAGVRRVIAEAGEGSGIQYARRLAKAVESRFGVIASTAPSIIRAAANRPGFGLTVTDASCFGGFDAIIWGPSHSSLYILQASGRARFFGPALVGPLPVTFTAACVAIMRA